MKKVFLASTLALFLFLANSAFALPAEEGAGDSLTPNYSQGNQNTPNVQGTPLSGGWYFPSISWNPVENAKNAYNAFNWYAFGEYSDSRDGYERTFRRMEDGSTQAQIIYPQNDEGISQIVITSYPRGETSVDNYFEDGNRERQLSRADGTSSHYVAYPDGGYSHNEFGSSGNLASQSEREADKGYVETKIYDETGKQLDSYVASVPEGGFLASHPTDEASPMSGNEQPNSTDYGPDDKPNSFNSPRMGTDQQYTYNSDGGMIVANPGEDSPSRGEGNTYIATNPSSGEGQTYSNNTDGSPNPQYPSEDPEGRNVPPVRNPDPTSNDESQTYTYNQDGSMQYQGSTDNADPNLVRMPGGVPGTNGEQNWYYTPEYNQQQGNQTDTENSTPNDNPQPDPNPFDGSVNAGYQNDSGSTWTEWVPFWSDDENNQSGQDQPSYASVNPEPPVVPGDTQDNYVYSDSSDWQPCWQPASYDDGGGSQYYDSGNSGSSDWGNWDSGGSNFDSGGGWDNGGGDWGGWDI